MRELRCVEDTLCPRLGAKSYQGDAPVAGGFDLRRCFVIFWVGWQEVGRHWGVISSLMCIRKCYFLQKYKINIASPVKMRNSYRERWLLQRWVWTSRIGGRTWEVQHSSASFVDSSSEDAIADTKGIHCLLLRRGLGLYCDPRNKILILTESEKKQNTCRD